MTKYKLYIKYIYMHFSANNLYVYGLMFFELILQAKIVRKKKSSSPQNINPIHFYSLLCKRYPVMWGVARRKSLSFTTFISRKSYYLVFAILFDIHYGIKGFKFDCHIQCWNSKSWFEYYFLRRYYECNYVSSCMQQLIA